MRWSTRNFLTFANTTAIAYRQNLEAPVNFWRHAIAVVFANVRKLRVECCTSTRGGVLERKLCSGGGI